jgi:hypothetical protein
LEVPWESGDAVRIQGDSSPPNALLLQPSVKCNHLHTPYVGYLPLEQDQAVLWKC